MWMPVPCRMRPFADLRGLRRSQTTKLVPVFSRHRFGASAFNQSLARWDMASVRLFSGMVDEAAKFTGRIPAPTLRVRATFG